MKFINVTLYDAPESGGEFGLENIDSIQMIICKRHIKSIPPPTTLVLVGREVRVKESIEEIIQTLEDMMEEL
jgi:uncharacterized protein YlzI (FlbEa/FlbD family)